MKPENVLRNAVRKKTPVEVCMDWPAAEEFQSDIKKYAAQFRYTSQRLPKRKRHLKKFLKTCSRKGLLPLSIREHLPVGGADARLFAERLYRRGVYAMRANDTLRLSYIGPIFDQYFIYDFEIVDNAIQAMDRDEAEAMYAPYPRDILPQPETKDNDNE